jgi:hypothetical protein
MSMVCLGFEIRDATRTKLRTGRMNRKGLRCLGLSRSAATENRRAIRTRIALPQRDANRSR